MLISIEYKLIIPNNLSFYSKKTFLIYTISKNKKEILCFKEFDTNKDKTVTVDELEELIEQKYKVDRAITRQFFEKVDVDLSGDLNPGEIVDFRFIYFLYFSVNCIKKYNLKN